MSECTMRFDEVINEFAQNCAQSTKSKDELMALLNDIEELKNAVEMAFEAAIRDEVFTCLVAKYTLKEIIAML